MIGGAAGLELERLYVRIMGDASNYLGTLSRVSSATVGWAGQLAASLSPVLGMFSGIAGAIKGVQLAASFEKGQVDFGVMLRDMGKGVELFQRLQEFAAETPLRMKDVLPAARQLLQAGVGGNQVIDTMRMLGDVTLGDSYKFQHLVYLFGQMNRMGKLNGYELRHMSMMGYNPMEDLAKVTGKTVGELQQMEHQGLITKNMVVSALRYATSEAGRFHNGMKIGAQTLQGLWSTLLDNIDIMLGRLGKQIVEALDLKTVTKNLIDATGKVADWFERQQASVKRFIVLTGAWAVALGAVTLLWPILARVAGAALDAVLLPLRLVAGALGLVYDAIKIGVWVVWTGVVLAFSAAMLVAKAAVWLFNAAMTVGSVVMALGTVTASSLAAALSAVLVPLAVGAAVLLPLFLGAVVLVGAALAVAGAAAWGAWKAVSAVVGVLAGLPATHGPVKAVLDLLGQWWGALKDVATVATVDVAAAWEMLQLHAQIAVLQVKDLWPPLWDFISGGFAALWVLVGEQFKLGMSQALLKMADVVTGTTLGGLWLRMMGLDPDLVKGAVGNLQDIVAGAQQQSLADAQAALDKLVADFKIPAESDEVEKLRGQIDAVAEVALSSVSAARRTKDLGDGIDTNITAPAKKAHKAIHDLHQALLGSAEAITRWEKFQDLLRFGREGNFKASPTLSSPGAGSAEAQGVQEQQRDLLKDIKGGIGQLVKKPDVKLAPAGI